MSGNWKGRYPPNPLAKGEKLTSNELDVVRLICDGHPNKIIADLLHISESTVKWRSRNILVKMGTDSRTRAAVLYAVAVALGGDP